MARSRKRKKTVSQNIVGVATAGLPKPVRGMLGNRLVSSLIVLALPALALTGIVTIDWQGGRPKLSIDEQRAAEVQQDLHDIKERVAEKIEEFRDGDTVDGPPLGDFVPALRPEQETTFSERPEWLKFDEAKERIAERITEVSDRLREGNEPGGADESQPTERKIRPLFRFN